MATNVISDTLRLTGKPNKKSNKGGAKGSVATLKESFQLGGVSQDSYSRKSILREPGMLGSKHAVKFFKGTWHQINIRERKGSSRGIIPKCAPHERCLSAPKFKDRSREETLQQERCARKAAWDLTKNIYKLKNSDKATFEIPGEAKVMLTPIASTRPQEREFVVDSGASMHMMIKKELSSEVSRYRCGATNRLLLGGSRCSERFSSTFTHAGIQKIHKFTTAEETDTSL